MRRQAQHSGVMCYTKKMGNIEPCMKVLGGGEQPLPGHQFIHTHIVFDIKMDLPGKQGLSQMEAQQKSSWKGPMQV